MAKNPPGRYGSAQFYREKARELLTKAETALSEESRTHYLALANYWHRLALSAEDPNW